MTKYLCIILVFTLTACTTHHADLAAYCPSDGQQPAISIVKNMEYDTQGRPIFSNTLKAHPTREGEQFSLVQSVKDLLIPPCAATALLSNSFPSTILFD